MNYAIDNIYFAFSVTEWLSEEIHNSILIEKKIIINIIKINKYTEET